MRSKIETISIGKDYRIGADAMNIIIWERHEGKRKTAIGKDIWKEAGYFATVQHALNYLVENEVKKTELKDLITVCKKIDEVKSLIHSLPPMAIRQEPVGQS
jgi:hypothetical protein